MPIRFWTISNILSLLRAALVLPVAYLLLEDRPGASRAAFVVILFAIATDFLDGWFARKFNQVSDAGKIIDPLADKLCVAVVGCVLASQGKIPIWFISGAIIRDVLIFLGGIYVRQMNGILLASNMIGKWAVGIVALLFALVVLGGESLRSVTDGLVVVSSVLLVLSFVAYARRFNSVMKESSSP